MQGDVSRVIDFSTTKCYLYQVSGSKESFANSADSSRGDYLDEEAERQAFKEAVEEWRRQDAERKAAVGGGGGVGGKPSVRIEREYDGSKKSDKGSTSIVQLSSGSNNGNDDWKDPFAARTSKEDVRTNPSDTSPHFALLQC
jgi:hypothetical protein